MKKTIVFCLILTLMFLTGCKSHLRPTLEDEWAKANVQEFDFTSCFDEAEGFHYPGVSWGMNVVEVNEATHHGLGDVTGYNESMTVYSSDGVNIMVDGRKNDQATAAFYGDTCYMVSVLYSDEDPLFAEVKQSEFYDMLYKKVTELYGEPDNTEETETNDNNTVVIYTTSHWIYETPDGKTTEMQLANSRVSYQEEPSKISFGFVWQMDEIREAEENAE